MNAYPITYPVTETGAKISLFSLTFDLPLQHHLIPDFRGAVASLPGIGSDLFHNHDNEEGSPAGFLQRYPLIQYRVHGGNAAIMGINEGAAALEAAHRTGAFSEFAMHGRKIPLQVLQRNRDTGIELARTDTVHRYRIFRYLPLGPDRYREYKTTPALADKVSILEKLLCNHILAFARGVGWELPEAYRIQVTVNDLDRVKKAKVKGHHRMGFDLVFSVNARLPEGVGIGPKTAFGFGPIVSMD